MCIVCRRRHGDTKINSDKNTKNKTTRARYSNRFSSLLYALLLTFFRTVLTRTRENFFTRLPENEPRVAVRQLRARPAAQQRAVQQDQLLPVHGHLHFVALLHQARPEGASTRGQRAEKHAAVRPLLPRRRQHREAHEQDRKFFRQALQW